MEQEYSNITLLIFAAIMIGLPFVFGLIAGCCIGISAKKTAYMEHIEESLENIARKLGV